MKIDLAPAVAAKVLEVLRSYGDDRDLGRLCDEIRHRAKAARPIPIVTGDEWDAVIGCVQYHGSGNALIAAVLPKLRELRARTHRKEQLDAAAKDRAEATRQTTTESHETWREEEK